MKTRFGAALVAALFLCAPAVARPIDAVAYDGLLYARMGTIVAAMRHRGQSASEVWHDQEGADCPRYLLGHSMGGLAALDQANRCAASGHPVRAVVTIDPTGKPGTLYCPKRTRCLNYYDPTHLIGFGARAVIGAVNVRMSGFSHLELPSVPRVVSGALAATR